MNPFPDWLDEVAADPLVIDSTVAGVYAEARGNRWAFSLTEHQAQSLQPEEVMRFLEAVIVARKRQIIECFGWQHPMIFHCWFDEQAGQLRFSMVSESHKLLPFGSVVSVVDDLTEIVAPFLASSYQDGLPLDECEEVEFGATEPVLENTLAVWVKQIP